MAPTVTSEKRLAPSPSFVSSHCSSLLDPTLHPCERRRAAYALCQSLDDYMPEPALLDGILPTLVRTLASSISEHDLHSLAASIPDATHEPVQLLPFRVLSVAHKVRGSKLVTRYYPHEVSRFASVSRLALFAALNLSAPRFFRVRAVLFYWLANLALLPFPLASFSSVDTVSALVNIALDALASMANSSVAAALFLARFVTRKDAGEMLENAVGKCVQNASDRMSAVRRQGAMRALAAMFKVGRRDVLKPYARDVMIVAAGIAGGKSASTTDAHLATKLAQRVALVHLPPRPCTWSYARGTRLLFGGAASRTPSAANASSRGSTDSVALEDDEVVLSEGAHADVEQALELVLRALENRDAVVRWSGAKGVGRITARLDAEMGEEVCMHVLGTFDVLDEGAWNGACLALAELLRRGLILPGSDGFGRTLKCVERAAAFDVRRGAHSVGEHVRDAACYVVWALARAYESSDVRMYAKRIARAMLRVALFDREVHCRRAAAAALQECVGRMEEGVIVEGIFLITVADFFALGDRQAAYMDIAGKVAEVADGEYFECVVRELAEVKLKHWDHGIRELAAKALLNQVGNDKHQWILKDVVPRLISLALTPNLERGDVLHRHGAVVALAELLIPLGKSLHAMDVGRLLQIPGSLKSGACYYGRSGDLVLSASCRLIASIAKTVPAAYADSEDGRRHAADILRFLDTSLGSGVEMIREAAKDAYTAMCSYVLRRDMSWLDELQTTIVDGLNGERRVRSSALAAGCVGGNYASENLIRALVRTVETIPDVEVRRNSIRSLGRLPEAFSKDLMSEVLAAFVKSMADYTVDDRGDVGSWIREATMESVADVFEYVYGDATAESVQHLQDKKILYALCAIVRQCCERIDRTRVKAGRALRRVYQTLVPVFDKPGEVKSALDALSCAFSFNEFAGSQYDGLQDEWTEVFSDTLRVFKSAISLLQTPSIRLGALQGLVASAGGPGHQSAQALSALTTFVVGQEDNDDNGTKREELRGALALEISSFFTSGDDRLVTPALCVMEHLAREGCLESVSEEICLEITARARKSWSGHLSDVGRTAAAVRLLAEMACVPEADVTNLVAKRCIEALVVVLAGVVPRLRRIAAEWLYLVLIELEDHGTKNRVRNAIDKLCETPWEQLKVLQAREVRNQFCGFVGVDKPIAKKIKQIPSATN